MRAISYSAELQKLTNHNATNRAPPTRPWVKILSNHRDDAPLCPHQEQLTKHMEEGEGGGAGACRAIILGGEEGESRDRRIHRAS